MYRMMTYRQDDNGRRGRFDVLEYVYKTPFHLAGDGYTESTGYLIRRGKTKEGHELLHASLVKDQSIIRIIPKCLPVLSKTLWPFKVPPSKDGTELFHRWDPEREKPLRRGPSASP